MKIHNSTGPLCLAILLCGMTLFGCGSSGSSSNVLVQPAPGTATLIENALKAGAVPYEVGSNGEIQVAPADRAKATQVISQLKVIPISMVLAILNSWRVKGKKPGEEPSLELGVSWSNLSPVVTLSTPGPKKRWSLTTSYTHGAVQVASDGPVPIPSPFTDKALAVALLFLSKKGDLVPLQVDLTARKSGGYMLDFYKLPHPPSPKWTSVGISSRGTLDQEESASKRH